MPDSVLLDQLKLNSAEYQAVHLLTPMQRDMYLDSVVNANTLQSSHGVTLVFQHGLDLGRAKAALQALVDHHSPLRARLISAPENDTEIAYLAIKRQQTLTCDIHAVEQEFSQQAYLEQVNSFIYRPYSLHDQALVRFGIFCFQNNVSAIVIGMHHIISDGTSLYLFRKQFLQAYQTEPNTEHQLLGQDNYFEFTASNLNDTDSTPVRHFWQTQLAACAPLTFHPLQAERNPASPFPFQWLEQSINKEHSQAILHFCKQKGITPAIYFKLLYCILLQHYCRPDTDFYIQEAYSIRPTATHGSSQGCYLQQLPFVVPNTIFQNRASSFDDLIQHAKFFQRSTKNYRAISLKLINELCPPGRLAFMYNFYHFLKPIHFGKEVFDDAGFPTAAERSVQLLIQNNEQGFVQRLLYDPAVFTDLNFLDRLESLSRQIVEENSARLQGLEFVANEQEKKRLLKEWNATAQPFNLDLPVHSHFVQQVRQQPDATAVIFQKQTLSYKELDNRSNQLAQALLNWKVGKGEIVALFCERHPDFLVAVLAILKAGGAYVPIDTGYPNERIDYMLQNSAARVVLTQSSQLSRIKQSQHEKVFCLDTEWLELDEFPSTLPAVQVGGDDRAYMIYTSGSTGNPKGALIHHKGALNHIFAEQLELNLTAIHFLQTAPTSSDISVWQFLGPIVTGGCCVIQEDVTDIPALIRHIDQYRVNIVELVPVVLTLLLDYISAQPANRSLLPSLKIMMATGEAVPVPLINRWLKYFPHIPITNAYGPTEAADDVIQNTIKEPLPIETMSAPIGKPLANFQIYILDAIHRLVPPGIVGEICIAGVGVGEGYWNNPAKTQESFIINPYASSDDSARMYKTGDLGRWNSDGLIEYIDRVDNQIKIRGHRIELGEIEAQLAKHPLAKECAVCVREDLPGEKYIAAYVIALDRHAKASEFKHFLKQRLPNYMVPQYVTLLGAFPTTPAGKIDRKNLPRPIATDDPHAQRAQPSTKVELKLAVIWQKSLKRETISLEDNFFDLGGHSVLAIKVLQEIENEFDVRITPSEFMQTETFSVLAQLIQSSMQPSQSTGIFKRTKLPHFSPIVPLKASGSLPPIFCIHGAGGNIFGFHQIAQCVNPEQPFYGIQALGIDGFRAPLSSVAGMAASYVREIQKIQPQGPYYIAGYSAGSVIALEVAQQFTKLGQTVAGLVMIDQELERITAEQPVEKLRNRFEQLRSGGLRFLIEWFNVRASWEYWLLKAKLMEIMRDVLGIPIPHKMRDRYLYETVAYACKEYKASAYPGIITLIRARDQDRKTLLPGGGWEKISLQPVEVLETAGDHHTIFTKPFIPKLASVLDEALELARSKANTI